MDDTRRGSVTTGQCVRCGWEAVGGICDDCLDDLATWLRTAAQTWRRYPPRRTAAAAVAPRAPATPARTREETSATPGLDAQTVTRADL